MIPLNIDHYYSYRFTETGEKIPGIRIPLIIDNFGYQLTEMIVYKDKIISFIGGNTFEEILGYINSEYIVFELDYTKDIFVHNLGIIKCSNFRSIKSKEDLVKEIEDCIIGLNHGVTRSDKCRNLFKEYLLHDSDENFEPLRIAHDDLPMHKKAIFEDVDYKDPLITLMVNSIKFSKEQRIFMLNDYFEEEYNENNFQ